MTRNEEEDTKRILLHMLNGAVLTARKSQAFPEKTQVWTKNLQNNQQHLYPYLLSCAFKGPT